MSDVISRYLGQLKGELAEWAEGGMKMPKKDPFDHGQQVGTYLGMEKALHILENILSDADNQEQNS